MLGSEDFSRCHQSRLIPAFNHCKSCGSRNHRLTGADITLHQSVHRIFRRHIQQNLSDYPFLCTGQLIRQTLQEWTQVRPSDTDLSFPALPAFEHFQPNGQTEQFFKRKPAFCRFQLGLPLGKMNLTDSRLIGNQPVFFPQIFRQWVRHRRQKMLDRVFYIGLHHFTGQSFGQRVDRTQDIRFLCRKIG